MGTGRYVIRGGVEGRERLRILSRVMQPFTNSLFDRVSVGPGMACLDAGCGGGDVTLELARRVGPAGRIVGIDRDAIKLELARKEAIALGFEHVAFHQTDVDEGAFEPEFDVVYARFLLTHLDDPAGAIVRMQGWLKPGGMLLVEDIDFTGHFCHPDSPAFRRYVELYTQTVQRHGGDPHIGPRLPGLLMESGFDRVEMHVVQPAGIDGEVKLLNPLTMENIADSVIADGLASPTDVEAIIADLYEFSHSPRTVVSLPRIIQAWGRRR